MDNKITHLDLSDLITCRAVDGHKCGFNNLGACENPGYCESKELPQMSECKTLLKSLSNSAAIISQSLNSGDFVPEFRYKNFEKDIKAAREYLAQHGKEE